MVDDFIFGLGQIAGVLGALIDHRTQLLEEPVGVGLDSHVDADRGVPTHAEFGDVTARRAGVGREWLSLKAGVKGLGVEIDQPGAVVVADALAKSGRNELRESGIDRRHKELARPLNHRWATEFGM